MAKRPKKPPKSNWSVEVEKLGTRAYRTMFAVGEQGFQIAYSDDCDPPGEAKQHCVFIQRMFLKALAAMKPGPTPQEGIPALPEDLDEDDSCKHVKGKNYCCKKCGCFLK